MKNIWTPVSAAGAAHIPSTKLEVVHGSLEQVLADYIGHWQRLPLHHQVGLQEDLQGIVLGVQLAPKPFGRRRFSSANSSRTSSTPGIKA